MDYWQKLRDLERRNRMIRSLRKQGWPATRIAAKFGITRARVYQVLSA
jgi:DNA-directed RNA polymerase specialized sigma subunit